MSTCVRRSAAKCARVPAVVFTVSEPTPSSSPSQAPVLPPNPRDARRPLGRPVRIGLAPATVALVVLSAMASVPHFLGRPLPHGLFISELLNHVPAGTPAEDVPEILAQIQATGGHFLPEVLRGGQVWRLFTPMFVHLSWAHLILNMLALVQFGGLLERRYGVGRFLALVAVLALISNVSQYVGAGPGFGGMSGVIFGLFGYVWIHGRVNPEGLGYVLDPQTVTATMVWFFLCFSGIIPIANFAHAGGLITGAALGWIVARHSMRDVLARRKQFQQSVEEAGDGPLHRCHVCGRTERDADNSLDFRVSSVDGEDYCEEHLPARPS